MAGENKIGLTPQTLRPVAAPTDQYIRPSAASPMAQLAQGLQGIAPSLSRFAEVVNEKKSAEDQIAGANKARDLMQEGKTYADAVRGGLIEPHQSPWFRVGAYETFGRVSANTYAGDLDVAFKNSPAAGSTNPKDFDAFEQKFRADWSKEHLGDQQDPYFQNAFGSHADSAVGGLRTNFASQAGAKLVAQTADAFHAEVFQTVEQFQSGKIAKEMLPGLIDLAQKRQFALGHMGWQQINEMTASAITAAAVRHKDLSMLDAMDQIQTSAGGKLSGTSYGSKLREIAAEKIASENQGAITAAWVDHERKDKLAAEAVSSQFVKALNDSKDPASVDTQPFIAQMLKYDPHQAETFLNMKKAFVEKDYTENDSVKRGLFLGIHLGGTTQAKLNNALGAKAINFTSYTQLSEELKTRDKEGQSKFLSDPGLKSIEGDIKALFRVEMGASSTEQAERARRAVVEAQENYIKWRQGAGKDVTADGFLKWKDAEVSYQFRSKNNPLDTQMTLAQGIPEVKADGPRPVDHKKEAAAPKANIRQLQSEFSDVLSKKAGKGLSPNSISLLRANGIKNNPKDIQEFIDAQMKIQDPNP
jgi:hypothetical protein